MIFRWEFAKVLLGTFLLKSNTPSPHVWVTAPFSSPELALLCLREGISIASSSVFCVSKIPTNSLRVNLSAAKDIKELKLALQVIARILDGQTLQSDERG